jgi:hypothetical protein
MKSDAMPRSDIVAEPDFDAAIAVNASDTGMIVDNLLVEA